MTSTPQHLEYIDHLGVHHRFRRITIKELYATCAHNSKRQAMPNCFKFPIPELPLPDYMIVRLHRFYKIFQNDDFREDQYLCCLAGAHNMLAVRDLFQSLLPSKLATLDLTLTKEKFNRSRIADFRDFRYELRLCWLRALITHEPYQLIVPELFGRNEEESE